MRIICLLLLGAAALSGCKIHSMAIVSTGKTAYATQNNNKMLFCDATSGRPVCKELIEE